MTKQNITQRSYSVLDKLLIQTDKAIKTLSSNAPKPTRPSPADGSADSTLTEEQRRHVAGLMRINHTGEVMAQALYQGQALTATLPDVRDKMDEAADEEIDHLAWCSDRVKELDSHTSVLNPIFYGLSFSMGATAGLISDKLSLGFVAAIEDQVCKHLSSHLDQLPENDLKSKAILEQMLIDESHHADVALQAGGIKFPYSVKTGMTIFSKIMTKSTYYL